MLAADRVTLDAHTARYRLAARGGCSHPTHEGMRSFPRTAPRGDIIADRLGGQNRWPLTVVLSGGGGGTGCCKAIVDGTLLAPTRKIALSPGLVNGQVISGLDISIVSGSSVRCRCPTP